MRTRTRTRTRARAIFLGGAIVGALVVGGCTAAPASAPPTVAPTLAPSPSPTPLAVGSFTSHGVAAELDARGAGDNVTGTMTLLDAGLRATVALECARTTDAGLVMIGGLVTDSTFDDNFPQGHRVAIVFQRGSPLKAVWWVALVAEQPVDSCRALVDDVIDPAEAMSALEPIEGTVELAP